jgi:hypothetical protein
MHPSHHAPGHWRHVTCVLDGPATTLATALQFLGGKILLSLLEAGIVPERRVRPVRAGRLVHGRRFGQSVAVAVEAAGVVTSGPADEKMASSILLAVSLYLFLCHLQGLLNGLG